MELEELKEAVVKVLMSDKDYLIEDAEEKVEDSVNSFPQYWNENANPTELANMLDNLDEDD